MSTGLPGSEIALSLAQNPAALITMTTAAGVLVTVGAVAWTYKAYTNYEEKKHRKEIEFINQLHKKHLEKIPIFDNKEIQGFPPIFKLKEGEKASAVDALHFTDDEIKAVGNATAEDLDPSLDKYRELILNAILKLKEYYFSRKERHDVTASIISYLLYMLEKYCLNFQGYVYDNAYLQAFAEFMIAYMSIDKAVDSQHFEHLNPVRAYLLAAKQELEKHQKSLSLSDMLSELNKFCKDASKKLIRIFVQMITPVKDWKYVETATFDELQANVLRKKYTKWRILGVPWRDKKIEIPKSNFNEWLSWLLMYFEESIDTDSPMTIDDVLEPAKIFSLPDLEKRHLLKKKGLGKTTKEWNDLQALNDELKALRQVFASCDNFVTMKLDKKTAEDTPKFIHVTKKDELIERADTYVGIATLAHKVISLKYLCHYLIDSTKQLGLIYMRNPSHFVMIFEVVNGMCDEIKQSVDDTKELIVNIKKENLNKGRLEDQELFPETINKLLDSVHTTTTRLAKQIQEYRDSVAGNEDFERSAVESVKHALIEVANKLAAVFNIKPQPQKHTPGQQSSTDAAKPAPAAPLPKPRPFKSAPRTYWQANRIKIMGGIFLTVAILSLIVAAAISIFSAGTLSPLAVLVAGAGMKIGISGLVLVGADAVFGLACGMIAGGVIDAAISASVSVRNCLSSSSVINTKLEQSNKKSNLRAAAKPAPVPKQKPMSTAMVGQAGSQAATFVPPRSKPPLVPPPAGGRTASRRTAVV